MSAPCVHLVQAPIAPVIGRCLVLDTDFVGRMRLEDYIRADPRFAIVPLQLFGMHLQSSIADVDAAFLDPREDFSVTDRVRERLFSLPLVLMSTIDTDAHRIDELGALAFLRKPVDARGVATVLELIARRLGECSESS